MTRLHVISWSLIGVVGLAAGVACAQPAFEVSTGTPDGLMAVASRPESAGNVEIEAADDFVVTTRVRITAATLTGLIPLGASLKTVQTVGIEIYRLFPLDSDTVRAIHVPTRNNSPSDVAFAAVEEVPVFSVELISKLFIADNSVLNGIRPSPDQQTRGEGPVTGREVKITANLLEPIELPPGHYFLVPQVKLKAGQFFWLSTPKPIAAPGTPFVGDLQAWVRNGNLDPDWLRVGTDIIGAVAPQPAPTFNMAFELLGKFECYPNCDGSSVSPALNVNDFQCFLNSFAAGNGYANCDESTVAPVLNVNDFQCFVNQFAAGCE